MQARMRGAGGCAGAPPAAAASAATTATDTSTAGAATATATTVAAAVAADVVAGAATVGRGSQSCPPRGSRHFLPDGGSVQARWTHDELQPVAAAAAVVHRA